MPLSKDLREFVELLNSKRVEYLVVGAFAVSYHGFPRYTADLDLLVRPESENATRFLAALAEFGFGSLGIAIEDITRADRVLQLGVKPNRIDIVTSISGVSFDEAWASRSEGMLDEVPVQFIGKDALIRNKQATGRAKDLGDAEELKKRGE